MAFYLNNWPLSPHSTKILEMRLVTLYKALSEAYECYTGDGRACGGKNKFK